jgi:hypothetical protein
MPTVPNGGNEMLAVPVERNGKAVSVVVAGP